MHMMINDENKKSIGKMLKSRTLYIALGVCLLAAGAVGFNSVNSKLPDVTAEKTTAAEKTTYKNVNDPVFHREMPTLTDPEPISEAPTNAPETEPATQAVFDNDSQTLEESTEAEVYEPVSFTLPVNGQLMKDYSMGEPVFSSTMSDYRTHNGIDIGAQSGTTVKTAAPGKVTAVISDPVWGNTVEVDNGSGYVTRISGLADEGLVSEGEALQSDTPIGIVGTVPVEAQDGAHIHLEVRLNGELQDPLEVLGLTETDD